MTRREALEIVAEVADARYDMVWWINAVSIASHRAIEGLGGERADDLHEAIATLVGFDPEFRGTIDEAAEATARAVYSTAELKELLVFAGVGQSAMDSTAEETLTEWLKRRAA